MRPLYPPTQASITTDQLTRHLVLLRLMYLTPTLTESHLLQLISETYSVDLQLLKMPNWRMQISAPTALLGGITDLNSASFRAANLAGAQFAGVEMPFADFRTAGLANANLNGANLDSADFRFTDLDGADFTNANLGNADIRFVDLSVAVFSNTVCPDSSNSDDNGGTCFPLTDAAGGTFLPALDNCAMVNPGDFQPGCPFAGAPIKRQRFDR